MHNVRYERGQISTSPRTESCTWQNRLVDATGARPLTCFPPMLSGRLRTLDVFRAVTPCPSVRRYPTIETPFLYTASVFDAQWISFFSGRSGSGDVHDSSPWGCGGDIACRRFATCMIAHVATCMIAHVAMCMCAVVVVVVVVSRRGQKVKCKR